MYSKNMNPGRKIKHDEKWCSLHILEMFHTPVKKKSLCIFLLSHLWNQPVVSMKRKINGFGNVFITKTHSFGRINSRRFIFQELCKRFCGIIKLFMYWSARNQEKRCPLVAVCWMKTVKVHKISVQTLQKEHSFLFLVTKAVNQGYTRSYHGHGLRRPSPSALYHFKWSVDTLLGIVF